MGIISRRQYKNKHTGEDLILKILAIGQRSGKPVAAAGNVRTASQDWGMFRCGATYYTLKGEDLDMPLPKYLYTEENGAWDISLPDLLGTEELLDAFSFLGKELAETIVIHVPNSLADQCSEIRIFPEDVHG